MNEVQTGIKPDEFGILQVIRSHKMDVRKVCGYPNGGMLTASRDNRAKLYQPEDPTNRLSELVETQNFVGPTMYASCICYGKTKSGDIEIYVGSHDMNIYIYNLHESKPVATLCQHSGQISAIAFRVCNDENVLISGSWDSTATIWTDRIPKVTLIGHVHAVWDLAFVARSFVLTAGADKTIRKWDLSDGKLLTMFEGHTDCVRGLAVIDGQQFVSCSNDATIILWNMNGDVIKTFHGHENFIFDLCLVREPMNPNAERPLKRPFKIVSVSEDKTVKVWHKDSGLIQSIPLQATTLWSVAAMDNGNFVVGTSDGHAYIFSNSSAAGDSQDTK